MTQHHQREIFRLIEREADKGASMSATVEKVSQEFGISTLKAEAAVMLWIQFGGLLKVGGAGMNKFKHTRELPLSKQQGDTP